VGPICRCVDDAGIIWAVLAGQDQPSVGGSRGPLRFRRLTGYFDRPIEPALRDRYERALGLLRAAGGSVADAQLPNAEGILDAYVNIVLPEGAAWHARYLDRQGADYTPMVRARFESGRQIPAVKYIEAQQFCRQLEHDVDALLEGVDAVVVPTLPITAPVLGSDMLTIDPAVGDRTAVRSAMLKHTQPFNMSGHPAISLPLPGAGLPVGLQLVGRRGETPALLAIAAACEKMIANA
jgi:aspartyl-tRNA(Asn)/glutamyl-tRNA(Gln) amidotransferase subunit A